MAIVVWLFGSLSIFIVFTLFVALAPAVQTVFEFANDSVGDTFTNATFRDDTQTLYKFVHDMWAFAPLILIIVIILIMLLASVSRQPESEVRTMGG